MSSMQAPPAPVVPAAAPPRPEVGPRTYIPSGRLAALMPEARRRSTTIGAYLSLMTDKRSVLPKVILLINLRHAPTYLMPLLSGWMLTMLAQTPALALHWLPWVVLMTVGMMLVNVAVTLPQRLLLAQQRRALTASLRRGLMRRIHRLSFAFHDRSQVGKLQDKFTGDVGKLEAMSGFLFEVLIMQGFALVMMVGILAYKQPWLLLLMLVAVPLNLLIYRVFWKPIRAQHETLRKAESSFNAFLFEALSGVRVTRSHAVEEHAEERLSGFANAVAAKGYYLDKLHAFFNSVAWASSNLMNTAVFATGVWLCAHHLIKIGDLLVISAYFSQLSNSIDSFLNSLPTLASAHSALTSLGELFEIDDHEDDQGKQRLATLRGEIAIRDAHFCYPNSVSHSLNGIDLIVPAGTSVALVGASGSGKSTLASVILGFYQPLSGSVLIDGHDLQAIDRRSIRRHVGVVSQDVMLFHDTVLGNIAWGDPLPDAKRAERAARQANAHDFIIAMPEGYGHLLGDRGIGLSGGQRQRLAIARALYRDPKLLILDEATSALDLESERIVQQALETLMQGRTSVIIAHRLSTVRNADRIVMLDAGKVVESGTFSELMAARGPFFQLANGQLF